MEEWRVDVLLLEMILGNDEDYCILFVVIKKLQWIKLEAATTEAILKMCLSTQCSVTFGA